MADLKLNTTNGSVTLKPEDGAGNVDISIPRAGVGKVLNVEEIRPTGSYIETSATSWVDAYSINYTPISDNSRLLFEYFGTVLNYGSVAQGTLRVNSSISGGQNSHFIGDNGNVAHMHTDVYDSVLDNNSSLTTKTYTVQIHNGDVNGNNTGTLFRAYTNNGAGMCVLRVTEIAN